MATTFPTGWALQKPQQTVDAREFTRLQARNTLIILRKYDGRRVHVLTAGAATRIVSRNGTEDYTDLLPELVAAFHGAPHDLLVDGELYALDNEGVETIQDILNGGPGKAAIAAFDLLHTGGDALSWAAGPYRERFHHLGAVIQAVDNDAVMIAAQAHNDDKRDGRALIANGLTPADYITAAEANGIEGYVAWDLDAPHVLNTNGNTKRGRSWKIKPRTTDDLVVTKVHACADPALGCGSLQLARQLENGSLEALGKVGSFDVGFDRHAALTMKTPFVVEVSHYGIDSRQNITFGLIIRIRNDLMADFKLTA